MAARTPVESTSSGTTLMIALVASAVGFAMWMATQRTALHDDVKDRADFNWPDMRLDINRANAAELALLPGLGERLAQRILDDRARNGRFASVDELERVPGVGDTMIERLREYVVAE
jgi:competence protein ComEA